MPAAVYVAMESIVRRDTLSYINIVYIAANRSTPEYTSRVDELNECDWRARFQGSTYLRDNLYDSEEMEVFVRCVNDDLDGSNKNIDFNCFSSILIV